MFCPEEEWGKSQKKKEGGGGGRYPSFPSHPLFLFLALAPFLVGKTAKIPFLGLSLLLKPTKMLATQAMGKGSSDRGGSLGEQGQEETRRGVGETQEWYRRRRRGGRGKGGKQAKNGKH